MTSRKIIAVKEAIKPFPCLAGGRSKWHEEQPAGSCRRAQNLRERPPADPTLLIGPTSAFDTGDKGTCRPSFI
jgi:hypothetical protein